jgi:uncharacterized protein YceK
MSLRGSVLSAGLWLLTALLAAGCASTGVGTSPAEEVVLVRAQARLDALRERNWAAAYPFLTPAYRAIVPQQRYANQFQGPIQWEAAKAKGAKCEEKRCLVDVEISFRLLLPGHSDRVSSTNFEEVWVLEDGVWYKFEPV